MLVQVVQDDGVEFPTTTSSYQDPQSGELVSVDVPNSKFCVRCRSACYAGLPYLDDEKLESEIEESSATKELCVKVVAIHYSNEAVAHTDDSVHTTDGCKQTVVHIVDGFFRDEFPEGHGGCTPEELKIPAKVYTDKGSGRQMEIFWTPGKPSFRMFTEISSACLRQTNQMPSLVYSEQPAHTHRYMSNNLAAPAELQLFATGPYLTRSSVNKAIKDVQSARPSRTGARPGLPPSAMPAPHVAASTPANSSLPSFLAGGKVSIEPPVVSPPQGAPTSGPAAKKPVFKVKQELAPPTSGQAAPAAAPRCAKSSAMTRPLSLASFARTTESVETPVKMARALPVGAPAAAPPQMAAGLPAQSPPTKRLKLEVPSTPRGSGKDLTAGLLGVSAMDLSKLRTSASTWDAGSEAPDTKGMSKFERAHTLVNLGRILMGENLEAHIVELRKKNTMSQREAPEWSLRLDKRLNASAGAQQLQVVRMMLAKKFADLVAIALAVQEDLPGEILTKFAYADFCLVFVAMRCLPPWSVQPELLRLLQELPLVGDQDKDYDLEAPSFLCTLFDFDDLSTGIVPARFCHFIEVYVLSPFVKAGDKNQQMLCEFLSVGLIPKLNALPESHAAPCFNELKTRALGFLCFAGEVPYMMNCSAAHARSLKDDKSNVFAKTVRETKWTSTLLHCVNMVNSGERIAWPKIQQFGLELKASESGSAADRIAIVEKAVAQYPTWRKQVRSTGMARGLRVPSLSCFVDVLRSKERQDIEEGVDKFDHEDNDVAKVLEVLQTMKAQGWGESEVDSSLQLLSIVSSRLVAQTSSDNLLQAFSTFEEDSIKDASDIVPFVARLGKIVPEKPAAVRIEGDARLRFVKRLEFLGHLFMEAWPNEEIFYFAGFVVTRLEVAKDPPFADPSDNQILARAQLRFKLFRRLQGWWKHVNLWKQRCPVTPELVEDKGVQELAQKLIIYHQFVSSSECEPRFVQSKSKSTFDACLAETSVGIAEFKTLYKTNVVTPLQDAHNALLKVCGAGPGGKLWSEDIKKDVPWKEFFVATGPNLRSVRKVELIMTIRTCDSVPNKQTG